MSFRKVVEYTSQAMSGGCFQRVLDAACEAAERLHQPLQFESAALRAVTCKVPTKVPLTECLSSATMELQAALLSTHWRNTSSPGVMIRGF